MKAQMAASMSKNSHGMFDVVVKNGDGLIIASETGLDFDDAVRRIESYLYNDEDQETT